MQIASSFRVRHSLRAAVVLACMGALAPLLRAQFDDAPPQPKEPVKHADDPIKIVYPEVDKAAGCITMPAAFWNQKMTSWVEVALCGRPSDFLHETVISITSTRSIVQQSMRAAGFHDADAWVGNVRDFPRVRGDRFIILLKFARKGKEETYSLDELLSYQGWGVSAGPYGWMFKGDPERDQKGPAATSPAAPLPADDKDPAADRTKILRDDPQIALVFKGIQHESKSFADHPVAYDDWVYPMMRYSRNYRLLPNEVYDSNGEVPVSMVIQKVTEEQFITETAKVWHDAPCAQYMLKQLPTAREIDKNKAELWALLPELKKLRATAPELRDADAVREKTGRAAVLMALIEKGYATTDAAWASWACDHPVFETDDNRELEELKSQVKLWHEHMDFRQKSAQQRAVAEQAAFDLGELEHQPQTAQTQAQRQKLRGVELEARSAAMLADNTHPRAFWKSAQTQVDPKTDPRADWIKHIAAQVELTDARAETGTAGLAYGRALQASSPSEISGARTVYARAVMRMTVADLKLRLADVDFELSKREGFTDDPDLPQLHATRKRLEEQLKSAEATTQPASSAPATQGAPAAQEIPAPPIAPAK